MKKFLTIFMMSLLFASCEKDLGGEDTPINVPTETTLTSDKVWTLKGYVYVTDGASLIIQPGTKIISDIAEKGALCIERGAKIIAEGTPTNPIIFTSAKPDGQKSPVIGVVLLFLERQRQIVHQNQQLKEGLEDPLEEQMTMIIVEY